MKLLSTLAAVLFLSSFCFAQVQLDALDRAREIKLLNADRESVRALLLRQFVLDEEDNSDEFGSPDAEIGVFYSTGTCDEDDGELWNVAKGIAVRVEIRPKREIQYDDFKFTSTTLMKEQRLAYVEDEFVFHDKSKGMAIYVNDDIVERIILFPPITSKAKVCRYKEAREFISHKSWFGSKKLEDRRIVCPNDYANVTSIDVSHSEVSGTTSKQIEVKTTAVDAENDVLTYSYTVTGGTIMGTGSKVIWDLAGARPGTYTITVGVDDGVGVVGQSKTKSVIVR